MAARSIPEDDLSRFFKIYPDILAILDFEGRFTQLNSMWETVLGFSQWELLSMRVLELSHPEDHAHFSAALRRLSEGEEIVTFEARLRGKKGNYKRFLFHATAVPS